MRAIALIAAPIVALLGGCGRISFDVSPGVGDDSNGDGATGDDGNGLIDSAGGGGDANGDAIVSPGVCGSTTVLSDDFADGIKGAEWTAINGNNLTESETGGQLVISFASNTPSNQEAGYQQVAAFTSTGACTIAEVVAIPSSTATGRLEARLSNTAGDYIEFEVLQGTLYGLANVGGSPMLKGMQPWSITSYRFLRIREAGGTWYWETSSDGVTYVAWSSIALALTGTLSLKLHATTSAGISNGGTARFESAQILAP